MYHTAHPFASIVTGVPFTGFLFTVFQFSDRFPRLKRRQPIPVRECLFSFSYVIVCDYRKFLFIVFYKTAAGTHLSLPLFFITQKRARPYALPHLPGPFYIIFDHSPAHPHLRRAIPWLLPVLWPKSVIRHRRRGAGFSRSAR